MKKHLYSIRFVLLYCLVLFANQPIEYSTYD